jgi:hypothetical protein
MHITAQRLVDEAMVELPGCPRPLVVAALRDVVADLLDRTQILTVDLAAINIVAHTYLYTLTVPVANAGYRINRPTAVVLGDVAQRAGIDWRMHDRTTIQLREEPQAASTGGLEVTVALSLDDIQDADLTDLQDWRAPIVSGVKGKLMLAPGKPWTDQQTGIMYRNEYNAGLSRALSYVATEGLNAPMRLGM